MRGNQEIWFKHVEYEGPSRRHGDVGESNGNTPLELGKRFEDQVGGHAIAAEKRGEGLAIPAPTSSPHI